MEPFDVIEHEDAMRNGSSVDLLAREDAVLIEIFDRLTRSLGPTVEQRFDYGNLAKLLIRHAAAREAAAVDIAESLRDVYELTEVTGHLQRDLHRRRMAMDAVSDMSRGVQGVNLNVGQPFHETLERFEDVMAPQVEWDLREGIPKLRRALIANPDLAKRLHDERYLVRHAPSHVDPQGPRWYERVPVVSRIVAIFTRMRDYPSSIPHDMHPEALLPEERRKDLEEEGGE